MSVSWEMKMNLLGSMFLDALSVGSAAESTTALVVFYYYTRGSSACAAPDLAESNGYSKNYAAVLLNVGIGTSRSSVLALLLLWVGINVYFLLRILSWVLPASSISSFKQ